MARRFRIGFTPESAGLDAGAAAQAFAVEAGRALGGEADIHRAADYRGLVSALAGGVVHVAWVPPLIAARAVIEHQIHPVALAVRNGSTTYSTALITHRESSVRGIADLVDLRAAWVDRESAAGYTVIRLALRARGVRLAFAFKDEVFARSYAEVARLVASRKVDVGATFVNRLPDGSTIVRGGWMGVDGVDPKDIRIVTTAGPVPCDFIATTSQLSRPVIDDFAHVLLDGRHGSKLNHAAKVLLQADGFVRGSHEHIVLLEDLVRQLDVKPPPPPSSRP